MAKVIAVMNEKGGVGKSATATTLAYLLAKRGHKTALIDFDGQGHASIIYGVKNTNKLEVTINTLLRKIIEDEPLPEPESYILKTGCGVDVIPSNSQLFTLERNLCNVDFRERMLSRYVDTIKDSYQYIIIDCMPQMGTPMINVMMCADSIIVPTQAELLSTRFLSQHFLCHPYPFPVKCDVQPQFDIIIFVFKGNMIIRHRKPPNHIILPIATKSINYLR